MLMMSFTWSYARAKVTTGSYDFFGDHERNRKRAAMIRQAATEMGGVIIKVGQFLSTRVDVLPEEYISELSLLQERFRPFTFRQSRKLSNGAWQSDRGSLPIVRAAPHSGGILGQVHRARLPGGESVVVKVKRPNIDEIVESTSPH